MTHHLGWVATTFTAANIKPEMQKPYNALWGQLIDLYGAVGHPAKVAHTVVTGTNNGDLISKILNSLTYFIRCCDVERKNATRVDVEKENATVDSICREYACIPKEYYKKYEDHLREMESYSAKVRGFRKARNEAQPPIIGPSSKKIVPEETTEDKRVVFVLGDDEKLEGIKKGNGYCDSKQVQSTAALGRGLKKETSCFNLSQYMEKSEEEAKIPHPTTLNFTPEQDDDRSFEHSQFKDEDFVKYDGTADIKPSTSFTAAPESEAGYSGNTSAQNPNEARAKSAPPEEHKTEPSDEIKSRYKYCGFKFNFQQYPQIVTNYMKSKNIELSRLPFAEKEMEFSQVTLNPDAAFSFMDSDDGLEEVEALQTPSNASELECVSDLVTERHKECHAKESVERLPKTFVRAKLPNTTIKEPSGDGEKRADDGKMKIISLPMPK